jgi:predicted nucleic-acid-binding protein
MRAVDTNVLVRLLTRDDPRQAAAADDFVATGAWVSHVVLVEAIWVLDSVYGVKPKSIAAAVGMLLDHHSLVIQDADVVAAALAAFRKRPALGFSDCLILEVARKAGHLPLGTFDGELAKLDGAERVGN